MAKKPDSAGLINKQQQKPVTICQDVYEGTLKVRSRSTEYLPQFPREPGATYKARLSNSVLFNAFKVTVKGLSGMISRKDPVLQDDVPDELRNLWEVIDDTGRHGDLVARDVCDRAIRHGHCHIFVDVAPTDGAVATRRDEMELGIAPYWAIIEKQQVLRFEAVKVGRREMLASVAWMESTVGEDDKGEEILIPVVRIYKLVEGAVQWEKYQKPDPKQEKWEMVGRGILVTARGERLTEIPMATVYAEQKGFMRSDPPLLDLALENILHYQIRSDRINSLHIAGVPIPVFTGLTLKGKEEMEASTSYGITLPEGGDAKYLEPMGNALSESREELRASEAKMAAMGLSMLQHETRAAETAEAKRLDKSEKDSSLSTIARSLQDGLETAMQYTARWMGLETGGSILVNRDFEVIKLNPQILRELRAMVADGALSLETLWDMMVSGEILPDDFDKDLERTRVDLGGLETIGGQGEPGPTTT